MMKRRRRAHSLFEDPKRWEESFEMLLREIIIQEVDRQSPHAMYREASLRSTNIIWFSLRTHWTRYGLLFLLQKTAVWTPWTNIPQSVPLPRGRLIACLWRDSCIYLWSRFVGGCSASHLALAFLRSIIRLYCLAFTYTGWSSSALFCKSSRG